MLKRDLLLAAAMCHDIGKTKEISLFPQNDYTDDGQLLGHIVIGTEMVSDKIRMIRLSGCACFGIETLHFGAPRRI